jgi:ATP/maltotriose-dependent transcriptional regulator MalT
LVPPVNRFTAATRALRRKIMSKTNHTSYGAAATSERELTIDELDAVSGGGTNGGNVAVSSFTVTVHMRRIFSKL